jgi:beta-galactosidase
MKSKIRILLLILPSLFFWVPLKAQELYAGVNYHLHDDKNQEKIKGIFSL